MYDILPTNGSATVLNTNADKGSFSSQAISIISFEESNASSFLTSAGDGRRSSNSLSSISIPA